MRGTNRESRIAIKTITSSIALKTILNIPAVVNVETQRVVVLAV
jgi:hypothetical protein